MNHEESILQQQCVAWFRAQYPQYAMLLIHPINEGSGHSATDRRRQGIHKAEGAVAGVPDLLLFMPAEYREPAPGGHLEWVTQFNGLGIEFKTLKGKQSQEQKSFQKMFESAGYKYNVIRSFEEFKMTINGYIFHVDEQKRKYLASAHVEIVQASEQREKEKFYKIIGKKK